MSYADEQTKHELNALENKIKKLYEQTYIHTKAETDKYFEEYEERYLREWKKWKAGEYTDNQFKAWVRTQLSRGEGWEKLRDSMASRYVNANESAAKYINNATPSIFALNANFAAYEVSKDYENIRFDLVDENVIKNLITESDNFTEFKTVRVNPKRDYEWNSKQIQNALAAGIIQGDSIDDITKAFMVVMQRNENAARRNARTACTSAQNSGRISTMKNAQAQGLKVRKRWLSASDGRVRDSHAHLNGQIRDVDKPFDNGLMFPADSNGTPAEVYNCRCTLTYIYPKYDKKVKSREDYKDSGSKKSYQGWLADEREKKKFQELYQNYTEKLGTNAPATLDEFVAIRKNAADYNMFKRYATVISNGNLTPLASFELYKSITAEANKKLVGIVTSNDITITAISNHFTERVIGSVEKKRSGVTVDECLETLTNKNSIIRQKKKDDSQRTSQVFVYNNCQVSLNPDSGVIIQTNPNTHSFKRKKS